MRVLLDEMLPAGLAALLPGHEVTTVNQAGFAGLDNGELLRRAIASGYEVLVRRRIRPAMSACHTWMIQRPAVDHEIKEQMRAVV